MNMLRSTANLATTFLPVEQGRALLVLPVRLVRTAAVAVATTTRHWELVISGTADGEVDVRDDTGMRTSAQPSSAGSTTQPSPTARAEGALLATADDGVVPGMPSTGTEGGSQTGARPTTGTDEPPVEPPRADDLAIGDWPELSLSDAQARVSGLSDADLQALLEYERAHGHRPAYTLLLERRLEQRTA